MLLFDFLVRYERFSYFVIRLGLELKLNFKYFFLRFLWFLGGSLCVIYYWIFFSSFISLRWYAGKIIVVDFNYFFLSIELIINLKKNLNKMLFD